MSDIDRKIALALFSTLVIAVFSLVYWLNEPTRMAAASEEFRLRAVAQGGELYAENSGPLNEHQFDQRKLTLDGRR